MRHLSLLACLLILAGCASPVSTAEQGDTSTTLSVSSAPLGSRILIDGLDVGDASLLDGRRNRLDIIPGRHRVTIVQNGQAIYNKEVYAGPGVNTVIAVR